MPRSVRMQTRSAPSLESDSVTRIRRASSDSTTLPDLTYPANGSDYCVSMNGRTLKILGIALGAFAVAVFRVTDEDVYRHREEQRRKHYGDHPRWTDKNRWE